MNKLSQQMNKKYFYLSNSGSGVASSIKSISSLTDSVTHSSHLSNTTSIVTDGTISINSKTSIPRAATAMSYIAAMEKLT